MSDEKEKNDIKLVPSHHHDDGEHGQDHDGDGGDSSSSISSRETMMMDDDDRPFVRSVQFLSAAFFFVFLGFSPSQTWTTTLHPQIGFTALALLYCSLGVASIFAPVFLSKLGMRRSFFVSAVTYVLFILAQLSSADWPIYLSSILIGVGAALLWVAQGTYISQVAHAASDAATTATFVQPSNPPSPSSSGAVVGKTAKVGYFTGLFFSTYSANAIVANLLMGALLNLHFMTITAALIMLACFCTVGVILFLFIRTYDSVGPNAAPPPESVSEKLRRAWQIARDARMLYLMPYCVAQGLTQSVTAGVFPAIVGAQHKSMLNFVFAVYGVTNVASAIIWGKLFDRKGWPAVAFPKTILFIIMAILILISLSMNGGGQVALFFVIGFGIGATDAGMNVFLGSTVTRLFPDPTQTTPAFSVFRVLSSCSLAIGMVIRIYGGPYVAIWVGVATLLGALFLYWRVIARYLANPATITAAASSPEAGVTNAVAKPLASSPQTASDAPPSTDTLEAAHAAAKRLEAAEAERNATELAAMEAPTSAAEELP